MTNSFLSRPRAFESKEALLWCLIISRPDWRNLQVGLRHYSKSLFQIIIPNRSQTAPIIHAWGFSATRLVSPINRELMTQRSKRDGRNSAHLEQQAVSSEAGCPSLPDTLSENGSNPA